MTIFQALVYRKEDLLRKFMVFTKHFPSSISWKEFSLYLSLFYSLDELRVIVFLTDKEYRELYEKTEKARLEWEAAMLKFCQVKSLNGKEYLRRLERVFRCCSVCETMEDYKDGYLMVWTNYMCPCSSIVGLYFKGTCDISVTMAMHKVHKSVL